LREPAHIAIRPVATSFTVIASSERGYRVRFTVPGARTVEVSGDFNQWQAIPLAEVSPHVWQATLPLEPGVHRVSVRVNGENWMAPPGIASVEDEFTGNRVGILVVK
jgi:1,4-alpha-glucan branching enzyme